MAKRFKLSFEKFKKPKIEVIWPKKPFEWIENGTLHISVPFTWNLPDVQKRIRSTWLPVKVGGPAVQLMPDFLKDCEVGMHKDGVLQRVNPLATRTTYSCPNKCRFCGLGTNRIEPGGFRELPDFPPGPVLCDNNLLAASFGHIERVVEMLRPFGWADFNQGLDCTKVTQDIANLIASIGSPIIRMALDTSHKKPQWERAFECWITAGIKKRNIRSYVLLGFNTGPEDGWERCEWVKSFGALPLPMWFHELDALEEKQVTEKQRALGWTNKERMKIMGHYYS